MKVLSPDTVQGVVGDRDLGGICDCLEAYGVLARAILYHSMSPTFHSASIS